MGHYFIHDARKLTDVVKVGVDLIVSSPPYFDLKDYGTYNQIGHGQLYQEYLSDIEKVLDRCLMVTKDTGSMWLVLDTLKKKGNIKLLPTDVSKLAERVGWRLQEIIIWKKDRTLPYSRKGEMRNIFEYILFFVKTDTYKYYPKRITSLDLKEWWVKYPERYSTQGKIPTDVWEFPIPTQGSWGSSYIRHFCPLPRGLIQRIIELCTNRGDAVFDPFAGSGAVLAEAFAMGREYIGCDLNPEFKGMFEQYLAEIQPYTAVNDVENKKLFASTVRKLRLLKLPSAVLKKLRTDHPAIFEKIQGVQISSLDDKPSAKNKLWSVKYTFVGLDKDNQDASMVYSLFHRAPFSKYGIESLIEFTVSSQAKSKYEYEWLNTHKREHIFEGLQRPFLAADFRLTPKERYLVENSV